MLPLPRSGYGTDRSEGIKKRVGFLVSRPFFEKLKTAAALAQNLGLKVNAGHGLNYQNVHRMHEIEGLIELNIGHSIISRAALVALEQAIEEMKDLII